MQLTKRQQAIFDGKEGEVKGKIMKTLVMYGEAFHATKMVDITSQKGHLVTSFGLSMMTPVYDLMDKILTADVCSGQKFSVDPKPVDKEVPANVLQRLLFKIMYSKQDDYDKQLEQLGLLNKDAYTCACYMDEVGNTPRKGEVLSWAESSAVVYANSVLGAKCNRNSGILELFGSIVGCVPYFGLLTPEGRQATWVVEIRTKELPEAQVLGSAIGMKVMENVPYVVGLDKYLGTKLDNKTKAYLKDFGAATASNGAVGLYHIDNLTPEAVELGTKLINENPSRYIIDDEELLRVQAGYPIMWKNTEAKPKLCFVGCPHLSIEQLTEWTVNVNDRLKANGLKKVAIPTVFTSAPAVIAKFKETEYYPILRKTGVVLSYICPLMYMNNPLCGKMPVITNSNKLRTYTTSRYYTGAQILKQITGGK